VRAYKADAEGKPQTKWSHYWLTRRYTGSPIIHEGLVFNMCGDKHLCIELETGKVKWEEVVSSAISSPLLVDGKIIVQENNGSHIRIIKADPASYQQLARAKADTCGAPRLSCPTGACSCVRRTRSCASICGRSDGWRAHLPSSFFRASAASFSRLPVP